MGFKCTYIAFSPGVPRDDIWSQPEGGTERAASVVRRLFGEGYAFDRSGELSDTYPEHEGVWVGTWGDTIVVSVDMLMVDDLDGVAFDGLTRWDLIIHSVVDFAYLNVEGGTIPKRRVILSQDTAELPEEAFSGTPLPFEAPYLRGDHDLGADEGEDATSYSEAFAFHPLDYGNSAVLWVFGAEGETPPGDEVSGPLLEEARRRPQPQLHRFAPAPPPPAAEPQPAKRGFFGLFRRG